MRSLVIVLLCGSAAAEPHTPQDIVQTALSSHDAFVAALAPSVQIGAIAFVDSECARLFGKRVSLARIDRVAFARCVRALELDPLALELGGPIAVVGRDSVALAIGVRGEQITSIGAVASEGRDAALPTFYSEELAGYEPSERTRTVIDKIKKRARAIVKVCHDASGAVTTRRLARTSGIPAFDAEARAHLATIDHVAAIQLDGTALPACRIASIGYPRDVRIVRVSQTPYDSRYENGVEGGVVGGVVGGDVGGAPPPPPPPPPPPAPPQNVPPSLLEQQRIAGDRLIEPDDRTKKQIGADGKARVVGSFKMCLDSGGAITTVALLKSTGYRDYDAKLQAGIRTWRYRPYTINGKAVPVCTAITFVYAQDP